MTFTAQIEAKTAKKRSFIGTLMKGMCILIAVLAVSLFAAHLRWKYSGSDQWRLETDKSGVKIYSKKISGSTLKRFRAVTRVKTSMNRVVAAMNDNSLESCAEWISGCVLAEKIDQWNSQGQYSLTHFRVNAVAPISPRELVLKMQFSQDAQSKAVTIDVTAIPDMIPESKGCVLVKHMHNVWHWTPLKDGEVEVEVATDIDPRLPYFLANNGRVDPLFHIFSHLQSFLDKKRFDDVKYSFIREPTK